jgi:hypothetical protein
MTHAAAAIRTLRSSRRRPHGPAAWERTGGVYDRTSAADGTKEYLTAHPIGLTAATSQLRARFAHPVVVSGVADIVHTSTAPALVISAPEEEV